MLQADSPKACHILGRRFWERDEFYSRKQRKYHKTDTRQFERPSVCLSILPTGFYTMHVLAVKIH